MLPGINNHGVQHQNYKSRPISISKDRNNTRKNNQISVIDLNANLNLPNLARNRRDIENSKYMLGGKNILKNNKSNINSIIANLNKNDIELNCNYNLYPVKQENKTRNITKSKFKYSNNENYYQKIFDRKNEKSIFREKISKNIDETNKGYNIRNKNDYRGNNFILKGKENIFKKPKNNYETNKINILINEDKKGNEIKNRINNEAKNNINEDKKENFIKSINEKNLKNIENVKINQVINIKDNENKINIVKEVKKEKEKKIIINSNKEDEINIKKEENINNEIKNNNEESKKENITITKKRNTIINNTNNENKNNVKYIEVNKVKNNFEEEENEILIKDGGG